MVFKRVRKYMITQKGQRSVIKFGGGHIYPSVTKVLYIWQRLCLSMYDGCQTVIYKPSVCLLWSLVWNSLHSFGINNLVTGSTTLPSVYTANYPPLTKRTCNTNLTCTLLLCHVFVAKSFALAVPFNTLVFVYALHVFYICHISSDTFPFWKLFSWYWHP